MTTLADYMRYLGWSNADLARNAGINKMTAGAALRGDRVRPRSAQKIVAALRVALGIPTLQPGDIEGLEIERH